VPDDDSIVDAIYQSIANPALWSDICVGIRNRVGASGCVLFVTEPSGPRLIYDDVLGPENFARYRKHYYARDLWLQGASIRGLFVTGAVITDGMMVERERYLRSEFCNDFMRPMHVDRMCGVVLAHGSQSEPSIAMSLYRPPGEDAFEEEPQTFLAGLAPHLRRAIQLRLRLEGVEAAPVWSLELLDQLSWGVFLLDQGGRIVHLNREARRITSLDDGLRISRSRLESVRAEDRCRLEAALARAGGLACSGCDLTLERPSGASPFLLSIVPVAAYEREFAAPPGVRVAVHVTDPERVPPHPGPRLSGLFKLTPAETRLAPRRGR
jgi:PAS domain-containing protein